MYLKKVSKKDIENYGLNNRIDLLAIGGVWYHKMNENGTKARNIRNQLLFAFLAPEALKDALESGEFTRVEQ
ncbi:hypothetical protein [Enterococcus sp. BWR-S5]|uniref:hypothetical protein n=1 Tax=Enterococcus sp. BWR-S5 TaxID=2787714 RepID=UPI0019243969|nr:hypothetical protein [Enterococcus sp. BWR-S5]MBL1223914.1 hypothetical protein [Enterococcus sp. BWR-S5]